MEKHRKIVRNKIPFLLTITTNETNLRYIFFKNAAELYLTKRGNQLIEGEKKWQI